MDDEEAPGAGNKLNGRCHNRNVPVVHVPICVPECVYARATPRAAVTQLRNSNNSLAPLLYLNTFVTFEFARAQDNR